MKRTTLVSGALALGTASALALSTLSASGPATAATTADGATARIAQSASTVRGPKPTVVLVHGAWADAAGWTPIVKRLQHAGYPVVAPPNPLRGLHSDAAYVASVLKQVKGPIILVGHSYGGAVITNAATGNANVKALVYIAAFAPDRGDSLASLNGSALGTQIPAVPAQPTTFPQPDGTQGTELTIDPGQYPNVFVNNELRRSESRALAVEQRPLSLDSVTETTGTPAWRTIPSWYLVAKDDRAIAPNLERFMAKRAGARTIEIRSPHLAMVTDPAPVTRLIETAAAATSRR